MKRIDASQRSCNEISGGGQGLHWDDLDEDISVAVPQAGRGDLMQGIAFPSSVPGKILAAWRHGSTPAEIDDLVDALSIRAEVIVPLPSGGARLARG